MARLWRITSSIEKSVMSDSLYRLNFPCGHTRSISSKKKNPEEKLYRCFQCEEDLNGHIEEVNKCPTSTKS